MNKFFFFLLFFWGVGFASAHPSDEFQLLRTLEDKAVIEQIQSELKVQDLSFEQLIHYLQNPQYCTSIPLEEMNILNQITYNNFIYIKHSNLELARSLLNAQMNALQYETQMREDIIPYLKNRLHVKLPALNLFKEPVYVYENMDAISHAWQNQLLSQFTYPLDFKAMKDFEAILKSLSQGSMGGIFIQVKDLEILNREDIAHALSDVALEMARVIVYDSWRTPLYFDELLKQKLAQYKVEKYFAKLMGLYAQRGASWADSAKNVLLKINSSDKKSAFETSVVAMSYIATAISVIDKIQWPIHHQLFSYPRKIIDQKILLGKPYYFWLTYYLTQQMKNKDKSTLRAVALLQKIYQLKADFNGRDSSRLLELTSKDDPYLLFMTLDTVSSLVGAQYALTQSSVSWGDLWNQIRKKSTLPSKSKIPSSLKKYEINRTSVLDFYLRSRAFDALIPTYFL